MLPVIDREFEFYEFFSFLKFYEFYQFCVKMSNKRKQTTLDLDQKNAIINEIEGGKNRQQLRWLTVCQNKVNSICMLMLCCLMA